MSDEKYTDPSTSILGCAILIPLVLVWIYCIKTLWQAIREE